MTKSMPRPTLTVSSFGLSPATLEVIHGKLIAAVDEMAIITARTSMSPVIYEVLDYACGICRSDGDLVAQANGITLFTGTFSEQIRFIIRRFGGDMAPGDTFVTNDPYEGGTHACDMAVIRPIFHHGRRVAFAINVAHWLDVGGAVPGSIPVNATSIHQEGLRLSGVRLARNDVLHADIERIISENVRLPKLALGDLRAQLASVQRAATRIDEVISDYGLDTLEQSFTAILDLAEQESRNALIRIPDGEYSCEDTIDGDGVTKAAIPVRCKIVKKADRLTVDFTGSAPITRGPINCSEGATRSAVKTVFKSLVGPSEPSNEGWFRPLEVVLPPDTVFSARMPAPTGWYYEGSVHASELVWRALAPLAPDRLSAGSYASLCVTYLTMPAEDGGELVHIEPQHGGWGACQDRDGASGLISLTDGDTYNYSIELLEAKFPLLTEHYGFNVEGGAGAGRFRGGYGLVREYRILAATAQGYCGLGRTRVPPWSMDDAAPGSVNYVEIVRKDGRSTRLGREPHFDLGQGDVVRIVTGGGGGWGSPELRDRSMIERDIDNGLISADQARTVYGAKT